MTEEAKKRWVVAAEIALVALILVILVATLLPAIVSRM
jgi:hypothetical protein